MGYNTYREFEIEGIDNSGLTEEDHTIAIGELTGYGPTLFEEANKWYEEILEMTEYSKRHPKTTFKITGEGEEAGDVWIRYYLNGKTQELIPTVTWPEFNVNNFKD
jgi:hypothetical protein